MIQYLHCPVCSSDNIAEVLTAIDHTVSHEQFKVWQCNSCTLRFTQSVPEESEIGRYYKSTDYISHSDIKKGLINNLYHQVRNITLKQKKNLVEKKAGLATGSILDVGSGTGSFLSVMAASGWKVIGLEPDAEARKLAQQKGLYVEATNQLFKLPVSSFDAITMWHVLEHVHELHKYMDQIKALLKPNGLLFIAVPNYTSGDANYYGSNWAAYDVPRHLYHFSPVSMNALIAKHDLRTIDTIPMWFDSFYVSMLSEKYKKGNIISALLQGVLSNLKTVSEHQRCSSLIYVIKPS